MEYPFDSYERARFGVCPDCGGERQERLVRSGRVALRCPYCNRLTTGVWSEQDGKFIVTHSAQGAHEEGH